MGERPPIPEELRRRILLEAGHRCAIHTCRHPEVDIHHIVPWEKCREHSYDNLIALCPNCHRRADSGEIDRLSLRVYKSRLVAALGTAGMSGEFGGTTDCGQVARSNEHWRAETIQEIHNKQPLYQAKLEFPVFILAGPNTEELNVLHRSLAMGWLHDLRRLRLGRFFLEERWHSRVPNELSSSYKVVYFDRSVVSVRYSIYRYLSGAAHGGRTTFVSNVQLDPVIPFGIEDLFRPETDYLAHLSRFCIHKLTEEKGLPEPSDWIERGAGPNLDSFSKFNVAPEGLLITFEEYQVDCYAAGSCQVIVPKQQLAEFLDPTSTAAHLWGNS